MQIRADVRVQRIVFRYARFTKVYAKSLVRINLISVDRDANSGRALVSFIRDEHSTPAVERNAIVTNGVVVRIDVNKDSVEQVPKWFFARHISANIVSQYLVQFDCLIETDIQAIGSVAGDEISGSSGRSTHEVA